MAATPIPFKGSERQLSQMVLSQGISLHYIEAGGGSEAVILLHGGMGDYLSWEGQISAFAPYFRVVSYSRRYHFPNDNPGSNPSHSCRDESQDLGEFLRQLEYGPVHLLGTSYGALTALNFAVAQPSLVLSLVLVEPPLPSWVAAEPTGAVVRDRFMSDVWQEARDWFDQGQTQLAMRVLFDGMQGRARFDTLEAPLHGGIMRNARAMQMLVRSQDPFPDLDKRKVAELQMPILLLSGEQTVPIHRRGHAALADVLPGAAQAVIKQAGHAPATENTFEFNSVVLRFLKSTCSG